MLNKQKGNMYPFVTHTWNAIKGECPHNCKYCYMKVYKQSPLHFDEKELKVNLGEGNFIFVGSSCDMFAKEVNASWILKVLEHCRKYPNNTYLFQTKNPRHFIYFKDSYPKDTIFGITLETNRIHLIAGYTKAPLSEERVDALKVLSDYCHKTMITIEPIMDFDLEIMVKWIKAINPTWVNIGADSKGHNLPEPSKEKIEALIKELDKFTEVKKKDNLKRLL